MLKIKLSLSILFIISLTTNSYAQAGNNEPIKFSHNHGFYNEAFSLTVTSQNPDALIYYTLDGTNPYWNGNAFISESPLKINVDPKETGYRYYSPGFIIRACAIINDSLIGNVLTQTYLFPNKIVEMSQDNIVPGTDWLYPGRGYEISYGLDPDVYNDPKYSTEFQDAFLSIPTISLVTDLGSLFDSDSGIYVNSLSHGSEWERAGSLELLNPDNNEGFQINCGIRIRGGWSRHYDNPKHAFRIIFRKKYGDGKLDYPLFGDEGANQFENIDLRTSQNYAWAYYGDPSNTFMREVFSRDTQRDMNQPYTRSRFYHLYINGTYWGLYQTQERSESSYAETYFGDSKDDYDVIKVDVGDNFDIYHVEATDGSLDKWKELWDYGELGFEDNELYYKVQGMNPNGSINSNYERLLDVDNLIDYMIITFFAGDFDGPISDFRGNESPNNFYAIFNRKNPDGFKFFRHDGEHTLFNFPRGIDRTGPFPAGQNFLDSNPQWIHQKLSVNKNYRLRFADRVYKHFFNDGALTLENITKRITERKHQIEQAIIAESARWGDSKTDEPLTKVDWNRAIDYIFNEFLPERKNVVLSQLINKGLYFTITPPQFNVQGGIVEKNFQVELTSPNGMIYYTVDGSDPRLPSNNLSVNFYKTVSDESLQSSDLPARDVGVNSNLDSVSSSAIRYDGPIIIEESTIIKTRLLADDKWSVLNEAKFIVDENLSGLKVTELNYHPLDEITQEDTISGTEFEFIEIKNTSDKDLIASSSIFSDGIEYQFPYNSIISAGEIIVLASNSEQFNKRYGFLPFGEYTGQLSNSGERIELQNAAGKIVFSFKYNDKSPWPEEADGDGYTLISKRRTPLGDPNNVDYWTLSSEIGGSPGEDDLVSDINKSDDNIRDYSLSQNYPNPFNPTTIIEYSIPSNEKHETSNVKLIVYDILGRKVSTLVNKIQKPGRYYININAENLTSGIYLYRLSIGKWQMVRKMILLK